MRHAFATAATALTLAWASSTALAGPIKPTLELQVLETWQTSSVVKGKTVTTNHNASSGIIVDTTHTGRVEYQTASGTSFGTFSSLSAIGLGDPLIGSGLDDEVDLSSTTSAGNAPKVVQGSIKLTLLLTETGLTTNLGELPFDAEIGGTLGKGMALSYKTYLDPGDHPFGETISLTSNSFPNNGAFSWEDNADKWLEGQFSMTELVTITVPKSAAATGTSFDASLSTTVVSEPGTATMLGLPLALIGIMATRRKPGPIANTNLA